MHIPTLSCSDALLYLLPGTSQSCKRAFHLRVHVAKVRVVANDKRVRIITATDFEELEILDRLVLTLVVRDQRIHARGCRQGFPTRERLNERISAGLSLRASKPTDETDHVRHAMIRGFEDR
jgi:hypothetical protein